MFSLAWKNITRRLGGSLMTALIAFIAVFVLATSLAVVASLENGLRLSRERLGADIMVLPAGASGNASEVLFCAEPVNVYLPADVERTVAGIDGVEQATPQFFTQTVNQSCCSVIGVTRVVGIDMKTDFIVGPWLVVGHLKGGRCLRMALSWELRRHLSKAGKHPFSDRCFTVWAPLSQRDRASTRPSSWM